MQNNLKYYAIIAAKDLKDGMKIIDEDDCDKPNPISYVFEVSNVKVFEGKVSYRAIAYGDNKEVIHDFTYEIFRMLEEPMIPVYFSSIKEGIKLGFSLNQIKKC